VEVHADKLIFDPQRPRDAKRPDFGALGVARIVIVANRAEIRRLGDTSQSERDAAASLLGEQVQGVVTKRGAAGSTVTWLQDGIVRHQDVGAHPTRSVWPIGSGDVFSAGLAHALDHGADLVEAAAPTTGCEGAETTTAESPSTVTEPLHRFESSRNTPPGPTATWSMFP